MKKALIIATVLLGLAVISRFVVFGPFAPKLYERAVERALSSDSVAALGPGVHVVLVGTGSPLPDPARAGPMTAVIADGQLFVFDVGDGATRRLGSLGYGPARVNAVFLTHLHSDHIDGLGSLMTLRWAGRGAKEPLPVFGPTGTDSVAQGFNTAYAADSRFRVAHHGSEVTPPAGHGLAATIVSSGIEQNFGDVRITPFAVNHDPVHPALGYIVEHAGRKVVITGDSTADFSLPGAAMGADLLVAEALNRDMVRQLEAAAPTPRTRKIFADIQDYHMSPTEAAELGQRMKADRTVLTHIVPAAPNALIRALFMRGVDDAEMGADGDVISLPPKGE